VTTASAQGPVSTTADVVLRPIAAAYGPSRYFKISRFSSSSGLAASVVRTNYGDRVDAIVALKHATYSGFVFDDWRRQQEDLPNRSESVRRLVAVALSTRAPEVAKLRLKARRGKGS
jgi:hypothetical protein